MARPFLKEGLKREEEYVVLISEELKLEIEKHIYGRRLAPFVRVILEDYFKVINSKKQITSEPFLDATSGKKVIRVKVRVSHKTACEIERERHKLGKMEKSEFIRYVLNLWLLKKNEKS